MIDIVALSDLPSDEEWTNNIMQIFHPTIIMSGNPWIRDCFDNTGVEVIEPLFDQKISATEIRDAWREGSLDSLAQFLDHHVVEFLRRK
jgi:hypothetical protein